ncbi:3-oxoacyl-ACP reductase, partial [Staphylococcus aureus]|uniref:3-oxoacyl-ACP reductase n=1 Tax=Staphylococcus aureus TaxID=1280 RepID=UPI001C92DBB8
FLSDGFVVYVHYFRTDIIVLTSIFNDDKLPFIQPHLSQTIHIHKTFPHIKSLHCLIYPTPQSLYPLLQHMKHHHIHPCYHLNLFQLIPLSTYFLHVLPQSPNRTIILISSISPDTPPTIQTIYSPIKTPQLPFLNPLTQDLPLTSLTLNAIPPAFVADNIAS